MITNTATPVNCQCNAGERNPILLCSILTANQRSCPLDLEFDQDNGDIVFTIVGGYTVHLTGYVSNDEAKVKMVENTTETNKSFKAALPYWTMFLLERYHYDTIPGD
ncbi:hypothetical protein C5167_005091 [Papaver somniferum]|uniref:Nucleoplasmin-like domain-containing protein n=1 Tax=Papaver somniferum TaxID=3469 RepID=A0A4Y7J9G9_PAPSO|nr:hypothetical protein C5167_005091 [Papaver somniferum]